jgi:hypothetical protein
MIVESERTEDRHRSANGGPRQAVGAIDASAARSGGSAWMTRQCPNLQLGQQSISIAATRRMKARASSMACETAQVDALPCLPSGQKAIPGPKAQFQSRIHTMYILWIEKPWNLPHDHAHQSVARNGRFH